MITNWGDFNGSLGEHINLGQIEGALHWYQFGFGTVSTTESTIFTSTASPGLYEYLDAPATVGVASTDPDDNWLGTGATNVRIYGLSADGDLIYDDIGLNGQTPVESNLEFSRIFRVANGSKEGHDIQGDLYVGPYPGSWAAGEPTQVLSHITNGYNQSQMAIYTVPKDYSLLLTHIGVTVPGAKEVEATLYARTADITDLSNSNVFVVGTTYLLSSNPLVLNISNNPFIITEFSDLEFRAKVAVGTANIAADAIGCLIPNKFMKFFS